MNNAGFIAWLDSRVASSRGKLDHFKKTIEENSAAYAFEWSMDAFEAAAWISVGGSIRATHVEDAENTLERVQSSMLCHAKYPSRSTSPAANLMHQCETAVYAEIYEWLITL